jgi:F-type H+-transporting ATPase subunit delta
VADNSHQISGVAERYASSLYELAADAKSVDAVAKDLDRFQAMIDSNSDLQRLVSSPVFSAEDQSRSIVALTEKAKISGLVGNFLKVVARNRRLFAVPAIIQSYHETVARERGEVTAEVKTAHALSAAQEKELKAALAGVTGKTVTSMSRSMHRCWAA